jgi:hypothetical protein
MQYAVLASERLQQEMSSPVYPVWHVQINYGRYNPEAAKMVEKITKLGVAELA